ncbi:MAG: NADH-quinone oxidoreductase subunit D [Bifidobacteriaceae bacterium]|jgi:NADH-quinone oxidoreductase subunit D|nr:NADH-quinone oxidoreductase subunit D [Bifidobacteriaceae bacterium]
MSAEPIAPAPDVESDRAALSDDASDAAAFVASAGGDWADVADQIARLKEERVVVNMGPQHPSTHGVLRIILELDGETVTETRLGIGYLHTGIEKTMENRTWVQGSALVSRMDYTASMCNELAYCLAVEKLLGIGEQIPARAQTIRVLMAELTRAASHLVAVGSGGNELGGTTLMTVAFREREEILRFFEMVTGLRMNNAYIRPGGVAQDLPPDALGFLRSVYPKIMRGIGDLEDLLMANPIFKLRLEGIGVLDLTGCVALGVTGPMLRAAGLPFDLRKDAPYSGYETYEFDVATETTADAFGRFKVRMAEARQSMRIVAQCIERLEADPGPVMVADKRIAWPSRMAVGPDGQGQSPEHVREIMAGSMESLIHHFKLVTEGFRVPAGQAFSTTEHPKGVMGVHVVSDGGAHPYRVHVREPSFNHLQTAAALFDGGTVSDVVVSLASIDPVMGGVDR